MLAFLKQNFAGFRYRLLRFALSATHDAPENRIKLTVCLQQLLRATPYWLEGHLELAKLSLAGNDLELGYSSAMAVLKLDPESFAGRNFLAQCYLKSNHPREAIAEYRMLMERRPDCEVAIREDLAAALMATGEFKEAYNILSSVKPGELSASAAAALQYLKNKV